ncbi:MAG: SDR family NAD(P)-dependent oxidoreductase [Bryobacteraceae bacterium]|jgi:uncharacterized oxidoreductase
MKTSNNTILITGGTSGIGFELATQFVHLGNTVIITGRDPVKLVAAQKKLPEVHTLQSDVSDPQAIPPLFDKVTKDFPELNILINNAGIMRTINLHDTGGDLEDITREIETNLNGPLRMVKQFLPHLKTREAAAIVNVSSGLAFVPFPLSPVYCATKAGLHSFTESLRIQLKNTRIKVFELAPPLTETPLLGDFHADDMKGIRAMDVAKMVGQAIQGIRKDQLEIRPGLSNVLKLMSRIAPQFMLKQFSKPVDGMLARTLAATPIPRPQPPR